MLDTLLIAALTLAAQETLAANNYQIDEPMPAVPAVAASWSDEFNGKKLDESKWSFDTARNKEGWYNEEAQYYSAGRPENLRLDEGRLIIEARHDPEAIRVNADWCGQKYSSARILTKGKSAWSYGFYEVRAKRPCSLGTWPVIWLLPEIDVWP